MDRTITASNESSRSPRELIVVSPSIVFDMICENGRQVISWRPSQALDKSWKYQLTGDPRTANRLLWLEIDPELFMNAYSRKDF